MNKELPQPGSVPFPAQGIQGFDPSDGIPAHGAAGGVESLQTAPSEVLVLGCELRARGWSRSSGLSIPCAPGGRRGEPGPQLPAGSGTGKGFNNTLGGV